jgi:nucleoside-diphosphate-sugar epimerase
MTVFVTGAAGFVGCHIVEALARAQPGRRVVAADLAAPDAQAAALFHSLPRVEPLLLDVTDRAAVRRAIETARPEAVVHGAAVTPSPVEEARDPARVLDVNLFGLVNMLDAAAAAGVGRVVFLSSTGVFGRPPDGGEGPQDETADPRPENLYGIGKRAGEDVVRRWGELTGIGAASLRLGSIFGRHERPTPSRARLSAIARLLAAGRAGKPVRVHGHAVERDWLSGDDLGAAVAAVLAAPRLAARLYHVTGPRAPWSAVVEAAVAAGLRAEWVEDPREADVALAEGDRRAALSTRRFEAEFGPIARTPLAAAILAVLTAARQGADA